MLIPKNFTIIIFIFTLKLYTYSIIIIIYNWLFHYIDILMSTNVVWSDFHSTVLYFHISDNMCNEEHFKYFFLILIILIYFPYLIALENTYGKTTRPFRHDLNQIHYDYTVEVRNRFKGLDLIDRVPDELWMEVHDIVQETGIKTISMEKKCKKAKGLSGMAYK